MPREDLTLPVLQGFQTYDAPPDAFYAEKRSFYLDVQGNSDTSPAFQIRRVSPTTGARTVLFTVTKSGDVNFTNTTFEAGDGTLVAPSYTFSSETTLGFFRAGAGVIGVAGALAFGLTPALTGGVRLQNQTIITERNLANNGDIQMIYVNASDEVGLNGGAILVGSGYLSVVAGNPATAGAVRIPNNQNIYARNAANTGNVFMMSVGTDDKVYVGVGNVWISSASGGLAIGPVPASIGIIRIPNNQVIMGRNQLNTQDIGIAYIDGSNDLQIGGGGDVSPGVVRFTPVAIAIGTNPAASGAIRIPNNSTMISRNAANNADLGMIKVDVSNILQLGDAVNPVSVASVLTVGVTPATGGIIRIPNNQIIKARNAANNADAHLISLDASDVIQIASNGQQVVISGNIVGNGISFMSLGTTPATAGMLRLPNAQSIQSRNAANTVNRTLIQMDASDNVLVGDPNVTSLWLQGTIADFRYATVALGGGAAPTFGTIGGSGPAAAAQNSWLKVKINGTDSYLAVWR